MSETLPPSFADLPRPVLHTSRLVLAEPGAADVDDIVGGVNDFGVARWLARVPYPYAQSDADFLLSAVLPVSIVLAVRRREGGAFLGIVGLHPGDPDPELGYWFARAAWGCGYATEAARAVLDHAFGTLGLPRVAAGVFEGNTASARVLEKLGFRVTGRSQKESRALGGMLPHIDMICERPAAAER